MIRNLGLYDTLDVSPDATQGEIKTAYRAKSKEFHPDKGGNNKEFIPIAKAYLILSDVSKRKRYDKTGIEEDASSSVKTANGLLQKMFSDFIEKIGIEKILNMDVVGMMERNISSGEKQLREDKRRSVLKKKGLEKVAKRIKDKSGRNNFSLVIRGQIDGEKCRMRNIARNMETARMAKEMLKDYVFKFDKIEKEQNIRFSSLIYTSTTTGI